MLTSCSAFSQEEPVRLSGATLVRKLSLVSTSVRVIVYPQIGYIQSQVTSLNVGK